MVKRSPPSGGTKGRPCSFNSSRACWLGAAFPRLLGGAQERKVETAGTTRVPSNLHGQKVVPT